MLDFSLLLQHCFRQQRSTQVAVVHCSAQTSPSHVLQKLGQMCMVISSNTGRVYRPKDCERLILYLKDLNLPRPDKWGTSQLIAFLHQVSKLCLICRISFDFCHHLEQMVVVWGYLCLFVQAKHNPILIEFCILRVINDRTMYAVAPTWWLYILITVKGLTIHSVFHIKPHSKLITISC